jgi:hypothetical protein
MTKSLLGEANMKLLVYEAKAAAAAEFVAFWQEQYDYPVEVYEKNIGRPFTRDGVLALFVWKNGKSLSEQKLRTIEQNFIARIDEVNRLSLDTSADKFLELFSSVRAIWRIFWLHCWQPERFPMYDQHVHRAMAFIERGERDAKMPTTNRGKAKIYLEQYLPFHRRFEGISPRSLDCALWALGKFLKRYKFPPLEPTGQ